VRESVGLPRRQLLIIKGVTKYTAHHRDVLEEERNATHLRTTGLNGAAKHTKLADRLSRSTSKHFSDGETKNTSKTPSRTTV